jgi:hypothetical protein
MKVLITKQIICSMMLVLCVEVVSAQWVQTNGPYGGSINAFAVTDSAVFAYTKDGV